MAGSTPIYGFPYPQSTDLVADYPTLGQELATDVETVISGLGSGLNIVSATSIANSGGTATRTNGQVVFSGVSSISLNGCFTSTYENYLIVSNSFNMSTSIGLQLRLRAAGSDATATEYNTNYVTFSSGSVSSTASTYARFYIGSMGSTTKCGLNIQLLSPQLSVQTTALIHGNSTDAAAQTAMMSGVHRLTTSYDGFTLYPESGTISGNIRVYGLKNS